MLLTSAESAARAELDAPHDASVTHSAARVQRRGVEVMLDISQPASSPMHVRIAHALRDAIRSGRLTAGTRLLPSRELARDLGVSRWVVTEAYAQLQAEGYLHALVGSGTTVRSVDADEDAASHHARPRNDSMAMLAPGLPDLNQFPHRAWMSALRSVSRELSAADLGYPPPGGDGRLRRALAGYLHRVRGAACGPESVLISTSITDGLTRVCSALRRAGHDAVGVEEPCWPQIVAAVRDGGMTPCPVAVDGDGLRTDDLCAHPRLRAVVVGPAHQYPTGVILSGPRRREILQWARRVDGTILEDDYDAEFRYDRPLSPALQGEAPDRVVLLGSLSKTLSPAMRIGWMVVPEPIRSSMRETGVPRSGPSVFDQLAFADMLKSAEYDRHLRRMRQVYRRRRDRLSELLRTRFPGARISGIAAGQHLLLRLPTTDHAHVVRAARQEGVLIYALSDFGRSVPVDEDALVLGYGNLRDDAIGDTVELLAGFVERNGSHD